MINIFNNGSRKQIKLLKEIRADVKALKQDDRVKELETQMDGWLTTLKKSLGKLETVSEKVDSK